MNRDGVQRWPDRYVAAWSANEASATVEVNSLQTGDRSDEPGSSGWGFVLGSCTRSGRRVVE
jgi:hypothetical protein